MQLAEEAIARAEEMLQLDRPTDTYLMVGLGGANAGELVVGGRGVAFICLEHFTGRVNPETYGMGLAPELIPLWIGHELAHTVRYTSPAQRERHAAPGGRAGRLLRLLVHRQPGHAAGAAGQRGAGGPRRPGGRARASTPADYFGYPRRQYHRLREMEAFLRRVVEPELERSGLGLRLRYLSGGMSPSARLVAAGCSRSGRATTSGYRMTEALVAERGIAAAVRAPAHEFQRGGGSGAGDADGVRSDIERAR